jgi:hypothetical protein
MKLKEISVPWGTRSIAAYSFAGCSSLEKVYLPESVREIGDLAFADCPRAVICAPEESPAILYAQRNGIKHEPAHA